MMQATGFTKEKDGRIIKKEYLDAPVVINAPAIDDEEKKKVINYLAKGERIFSITWSVFDGENYIGPYSVFSDGAWIWPSHFAYYLEKADFSSLKPEFLIHIRGNNFDVPVIDKTLKKEVATFLELNLLNVK